MDEGYLRWSETPYAGEEHPPANAVTPSAGSWPLMYLRKDREGSYYGPDGRKMDLPIVHPDKIDFERELKEVKYTLKHLTEEQKKIGVYYGTGVPTKQWTPVIDRLLDTYNVSPTYAARILAVVQAAVNDTMMLVWDLKYRWDVARPDQYDQEMKTLLCTPRFPTYPSGHATMSGCSEVVLSYFFPKEAKKLKKIAEDDAVSRLYGGVHFPSDNEEGIRLGRYIGHRIVQYLKNERDARHKKVDHPVNDYRDAGIFPEDYQQFIPYEFPNDCTSLVGDFDDFGRAGDKKEEPKKNFPDPKLFY
ncbi:vanadium-dependent haloperoxidase [Halobacillus sp. Marseille-Q1614]|uniref:vanadium-dependent haloperoxidase n=1 Tax=Halobacillus sp. Marseille-Q1614 TaxID=2709134 RepID=UPI001570337D|nr:vanadium-dependent haloperoxidase [Halobacillus sp. Marseille-Q1614]